MREDRRVEPRETLTDAREDMRVEPRRDDRGVEPSRIGEKTGE
jgi:hypothetical protein